jgi:hypothetical protein
MADDIPSEVEKLLDPTMKADLFEKVTVGTATYYFIDQYDDEGGEPVIVRQAGGEPPSVVEDIVSEDDTAGGAAANFSSALQERLKAIRGIDEDERAPIGGGGPLTQSQLDKKLKEQAERCADRESPDHLKSNNAPGTNNGRLACAWAVNRVAKMALGKQIGGGLATANMIVVLKNEHKRLEAPVPGCVVISPTENRPGGGRNIGHVGIVGEVGSQPSNTKIYSNSSSRARFEQNFSHESWVRRYKTEKGLKVFFFELDPSLFPNAES